MERPELNFSHVTAERWDDPAWQIKNRFKGVDGLRRLPLNLSTEETGQFKELLKRYRWAATPYYLSLINWDDPLDPIRLQCVPCTDELKTSRSMLLSGDPLSEKKFTRLKGLIHRYPDRALILVTGECASYCRHCNRKRTWKRPEAALGQGEIHRIYSYIKADTNIREVILSGGDPLMLAPAKLKGILSLFRDIPHVEVLRIGTRLPVTMPMGITKELCDILAEFRPLWINTHFNHPSEITETAAQACNRLQLSGIPVSNQTVLLKGVNDSFDVLSSLFKRLETIMVRPYYLFHCEPVSGNLHFIPSIKKGISIMEKIRKDLGGLCLPSYVLDLPDGGGKAPLMPSWLIETEKGHSFFRTFDGKVGSIKWPGP